MSTRYQYYITGDDASAGCFGVQWLGQTFTPAIAHKIESVKLKLYRVGSPGTITVSIRATDGGGDPTGADLCSGTTDGNVITTNTNGAWYEITFTTGTNLSIGTIYAIVFRATAGDASNKVLVRHDNSSPSYAGGEYEISGDSGSSWTPFATSDFMFEEWGTALGIAAAPSVDTKLTFDVLETTATGRGEITSIGNGLVTEHGHCWSTSNPPTIADSKTTKGAGVIGDFNSVITGLIAGTLYYIQAYATNSNGTAYGGVSNFTTAAADVPVLTTEPCTPLTPTTATGNGTITSIGGSTIIQHGHCWKTKAQFDIDGLLPLTTDSKTTNGYNVVGAFTSAITGLVAGTLYYVRAYATNTQGTGYGNNQPFVSGVSDNSQGSELAGVIKIKGESFVYFSITGRRYYIQGVEY